MDEARYGSPDGEIVNPTQFMIRATPRYRERGILPYCPACRQIVHLYGVHNPQPDTIARFDHANLAPDADPLDDCVLAARNERFRGLAPDAWDEAQAIQLRKQFYEDENLKLAYAFCLNICRKGNLPTAKFRKMLARADSKRIWAYAGLRIWATPYILLTLENFQARSKEGYEYGFHFIFNKPKSTGISTLWTNSEACEIVKVYSDSGKQINATDNPYPVSEVNWRTKAGDASWISPTLLRALRG